MSSKKAEFHGNVGQVVMGNVLIGKDQEFNTSRSDSTPSSCDNCKLLSAYKKLQRFAALQAATIVGLGALALWLQFFQKPAHATNNPSVCYSSGAAHSPGSTVQMPSGEYRICHRHKNRQQAEWVPGVININTP